MSVLIKNGIIGDREKSFRGDLLIEGEKIAAVGESIEESASYEVIDAEGCYVVPGGIDTHTHVCLRIGENEVSDGFAAATRAAIWGGTTTIAEHPGFVDDGMPLFAPIEGTLALAKGNSYTDYGIHAVFQRRDKSTDVETAKLVREGFATGKVYLTYSGRLVDEDIFPLMEFSARNNFLLLYHAENNAITTELGELFQKEGRTAAADWPASRPDYCEAEAVNRILALAKSAKALTYIVHLSTALGLKEIISARRSGQKVFTETCPQYLCLDSRSYSAENGLDFVMAPPLRSAGDALALWKALGSGEIDTVGTDHCSFSRADKVRLGESNVFKAPGGVPGIETRMPMMFSEGFLKGRISLEQFVGVTAANCADILGISGKGKIREGFDADVAIIDPRLEMEISVETLHQQADYTPFEGMKVRGLPSHVWLRGQHLLKDRELICERPSGRFVKRFLSE